MYFCATHICSASPDMDSLCNLSCTHSTWAVLFGLVAAMWLSTFCDQHLAHEQQLRTLTSFMLFEQKMPRPRDLLPGFKIQMLPCQSMLLCTCQRLSSASRFSACCIRGGGSGATAPATSTHCSWQPPQVASTPGRQH